MSTKSSVFHRQFKGGGEVHCYYEMQSFSYWLHIRIPFIVDMLIPMPYKDTSDLEAKLKQKGEKP